MTDADSRPNRKRRLDHGEILVTVSIDTEEDNWLPTRDGVTVDNLRLLARLDDFLRGLGVRPTYFASYQVLIRPWVAEILRAIEGSGHAEIGAHLHPWNTPPFDETFIPRHTMLKNLPGRLQLAKLRTLSQAMCTGLGKPSSAFRAGRFGLGPETAAALTACGYRVDSSVTPYISWEEIDDGPTFDGAPLHVYRLGGLADVRTHQPDGPLIEVPISCGYNRTPFELWHGVRNRLAAPPWRALRLVGLADRIKLLTRIILSPENHSAHDMLVLSRCLMESGQRHLHLYWHSSSMQPGLTQFTQTQSDVERLYHSVGTYFDHLAALTSFRFATVTEVADALAPPLASKPMTAAT